MPTAHPRSPRALRATVDRVSRSVSRDTTGGVLLLAATALALIAANSPLAPAYTALRELRFGPSALHLDLTLSAWAADGLLALFFFVVGLELKQEFVAGRLRDPRAATLPVVAAVGGVVVPALLYTAVVASSGADALQGWAVPAATDIAFAVAVLAVVGRRLPVALRTFLLTLAVVDDLIAIVIIAVVYSGGISLIALVAALAPLAVFALLVQRGVRTWWLLIPVAVLTWALVHESGVHATIAGVALGLVVPARRDHRSAVGRGQHRVALTVHLAERWRPVSAGVAVPVFAFLAAGVTVGGLDGLVDSLRDPVAVGIAVGLVVGKPLGITLAAFLVTRLPGVRLDPELRWPDLAGAAALAGIGFTVSLLVAELAFGSGTPADGHAKVGILVGSLLSAVIGGVVLLARGVSARRAPE